MTGGLAGILRALGAGVKERLVREKPPRARLPQRSRGTFAGMGQNRLFVSQRRLDEWLTEGRVEMEGEVMTSLPEGSRFRLETAVLFVREVTGAGDPYGVLGKVKDLRQIAELGGEYAAGSVIIGDHAYDVIEGLVGEFLPERPVHSGESLGSAIRSAVGDLRRQSGELDLLARFLLQSRS